MLALHKCSLDPGQQYVGNKYGSDYPEDFSNVRFNYKILCGVSVLSRVGSYVSMITRMLVCFQLTRYMFHGGNPYGLDLASINIQRGRDHGVRSYNQYRRLIGLQPYMEFQEFSPSVSFSLYFFSLCVYFGYNGK